MLDLYLYLWFNVFTPQPRDRKMEIQNLRLQLLHIADGDVGKAQAMEAYVLAKEEVNVNAGEESAPYQSANLGEEPKADEEECHCPLCVIGRLIEKDPNKTLISISK